MKQGEVRSLLEGNDTLASRRRPLPDGFYDSAFGLPDFESQPSPAERPDADSSSALEAVKHVIALSVQNRELQNRLVEALKGQGIPVGGPEFVTQAALIVSDVASGVSQTVSHLRRIAQPDAAILLVLDTTSDDAVAEAHSVGAYACLRSPLVPAELLSFVALALDTHATKMHAADLARKLDLEAHLASIGRISAGLSHELGTPLSVALANVETIRDECARLVLAIEELALAPESELPSRLEAARVKMRTVQRPTELDSALEDSAAAIARAVALLRLLRELVGKRGEKAPLERVPLMVLIRRVLQWLKTDLDGVTVEVLGVETHAAADPIRLGQILQNLLANAIHAARLLSEPRVRLHVYEAADHVVVSVRDNGPGIAAEVQSKLFEPFFTTRRSKGGTGLGLALCREYALQMGADLSFWSVQGRGACFRVRLPKA
jgi:two-component system sensor histidine kinase HydH